MRTPPNVEVSRTFAGQFEFSSGAVQPQRDGRVRCGSWLGHVVWKLGVIKSGTRTARTADAVHRVENHVVKSLVCIALMNGTKLVEQPVQLKLTHAVIAQRPRQRNDRATRL